MKYIKFSDCLRLLLTNLGISSNRLSKAINVDSSLVNRWINGKRIPSYQTSYIGQISEFMAKNIYNTYQQQKISDLITEVCGSYDPSQTIKEQIQHMLSEAQGYSIECYQKDLKENKPSGKKQKTRKSLSPNMEELFTIDACSSFSHNDKVLSGSGSIIKTSLLLLNAAADIKPKKDGTIYLSYDDYHLDMYTDYELKLLIHSLLSAMDNGWKLILLIKLAYDTEHIIRFMNFFKPLMQNSRFHPYYIKKYDSYVLGEKLIIIPGIGSLICFANKMNSSVNSAFYMTNPAAVNLYLSHFKMLMDKNAEPLTKKYTGKLNFSNHLIKIEEASGNRFLFRYCFGMITYPEALYIRLLERWNLNQTEIDKSIELYKKRYNAFLRNIKHYQYWDIYVVTSIRDLIRDHQVYFYSYTGVTLMKIDVCDIIEHLKHIIHLLKSYDNYYIAFQKEDLDNNIDSKNIYCLVKERQTAFLEIINPQNDIPDIRIASEEPMLIHGFYEYSKDLWEHIAPVNKNKKEIIHWLNSEIKILGKSIERVSCNAE